MAEETLFSGESKNIEYKVAVPDKSEKYIAVIWNPKIYRLHCLMIG